MIIEYIRYTLTPDRAPALVAAYEAARPVLQRSPHSLGYDVAQCTEDPGSVTVRMQWDSAEGHLTGFRGSPEFREFLTHVSPFVGDIAEMRHYEPVYTAHGDQAS